MENHELLNNVLGDIGNFVLVIFGFSVTLFTVLYSFILNKRDQLIEYSDKIKQGTKETIIIQREKNAINFIRNLKSFNQHLIVTIFVDLAVYISCMFLKYFMESEIIKKFFTIILGVITFSIIIYVIIMLIITIREYKKMTKLS